MGRYKCATKHDDLPAGLCNECFQKQLKIDRLEEENARLKAQLRYRTKKNQEPFGLSTPSSKLHIKQKSTEENQNKKGGGQPGHQGYGRNTFTEKEADEVVTLKVKEKICPDCGGELEDKEIDERPIIDSVILEAKKIFYKSHVKRCTCCKTEVSRKPLVLPRYKYGNNLIAETVISHFLEGIPITRIGDRWGKDVSTSALQNIENELAEKLKPIADQLEKEYRQAPVKHADETGWRTDGNTGYSWLFCTPDLSVFKFENNRSQRVPESVLGKESVPGTLVVDRYQGYNKVPCNLQYCYEHLKRDLIELGDKNPKSKEVKAFVDTLLPHIKDAIRIHSEDLSDSEYYLKAKLLKKNILECIDASAQHCGIQTYQDIFRDNKNRMYHWVEDRRIPAHNNRAERELRPTIIARKISFGSQGERGAKTRSILMTVLHTVAKRTKARTVKQWLVECLNGFASDPNFDPISIMPKPET